MNEYLEFPVVFTFKIIGENTAVFISAVEKIFEGYEEKNILFKQSGGNSYISLSVTAEIKDYDELKARYADIAALTGLKFYV
jgi:putative lipoic acid-binding regulatory protein